MDQSSLTPLNTAYRRNPLRLAWIAAVLFGSPAAWFIANGTKSQPAPAAAQSAVPVQSASAPAPR